MALTRFTVRQLEAFLAVADARSFSAAADRLGMTAQAVSQLVAELESVLGFRLFDRTTRRVMLSSAGRDFLASAATAVRHLQAAEGAAADVRNRATGIVRVGAPLVLAATALPAAVKAYAGQQPKVVVRIRDVPVDGLVDSVAAGDVDIAVGPDRVVDTGVEATPLFDSPWVLWCAKDHPLARRKALHWGDLRNVPLVAAGHDHERSVTQMHMATPEGARVIPVDVVDNITTALGIAGQGLAATLAPAYVGVFARQLGLVMRRVLQPETVRQVCLYTPLQRSMSPATEGFVAHLTSWMPAWGAGTATD